MTKVIITLFSITALFFISTHDAHAAAAATPNCQPIYGGGQTCVQAQELSVNLQVKNPRSNSYTDNLTASDPTYTPRQEVNYRVTSKNMMTKQIEKITLTVVLPQHVSYVRGDGKYDQTSRKLTFTIDSLKANESKVFIITGKITNRDKLPAGQNIVCTFTQAIVTFEKKNSQDNSQFCIATTQAVAGTTTTPQKTTKGGLTVFPPSQTKTTPQTGPATLALFGLIPAGALGIWLRKKSL